MVLLPLNTSLYSVIIEASAKTVFSITDFIRFCNFATGTKAHPRTTTAINASCQEL